MMEEDKFFDPVNIRLFAVAGVMLDSDGVAHLVQEFFGRLFMFYTPRICIRDQRIEYTIYC